MPNKFEDNLLKMVYDLFKLTDKEHKEILKLYKQHRDNIQQFINDLFIKYGKDGKLDWSIYQKYNRMNRVEDYFKEEMKRLNPVEVAFTGKILQKVYQNAYYKTAYNIDKSFNIKINFKLLNPKLIKEAVNFNWSGVPFSERIWDNHNALIKSLRTELTTGIQNGESIDKIARRITKQFGSKAYQSQRLIRTESARVISAAQEKIYKDSGVVKYLEWCATLDNKTSEICRERDGKRWRINDPNRPRLPAHPNERSTWLPVPYDEYNPSKRKDNETKEIISYKNYDDWYKARVNI